MGSPAVLSAQNFAMSLACQPITQCVCFPVRCSWSKRNQKRLQRFKTWDPLAVEDLDELSWEWIMVKTFFSQNYIPPDAKNQKRFCQDLDRFFLQKGYDSRTGFSVATHTSCAIVWVETHDPSLEPFHQHEGDKTETRLNRWQKQENPEKWCRSRSEADNLVKCRILWFHLKALKSHTWM